MDKNMKYVVSDLHGEYELFVSLLEKIKFSLGDEMYVCGDIIDKGESSVRLIKLIASLPNVHAIVGNHEYSFLKYYHSTLEESPEDFDAVLKHLQSYFSTDGHLLDWETVDWLENLPAYIEEDDFICVHAGIPLDEKGYPLPLSDASMGELVWNRKFKDPNLVHYGDKCVFFGHTQTNVICGESKILAYRRRGVTPRGGIKDFYKIHLDTGTWTTGRLGCFCIDTCKAFYVEK